MYSHFRRKKEDVEEYLIGSILQKQIMAVRYQVMGKSFN